MCRTGREKYLKSIYHEAAREAKEKGIPYGQFTPKMLAALCDMAREDVYPDGNFGDVECNVWEMFHITAMCGMRKN